MSFSARLLEKFKPQRLILPDNGGVRKVDFKVVLTVCSHRDVKLRIFNVCRQLENCPNPKISMVPAIGDALIARSRARAATKFLLETDYDYLWFLDDDIVTNTVDMTKMMWQMYKDNLDIHGAPYCLKSETDKKFAVRGLEMKQDIPVGKGAPIQEIMYLSTGCMGISRKVLQTMVDKEIVHLCHPDTTKFYPFFDPMQYQLNGKWLSLSEDWSFCHKARDLGFKVYCDFSVKLGHIGEKVYTWDDFFAEKPKELEGFMYNIDIKKE